MIGIILMIIIHFRPDDNNWDDYSEYKNKAIEVIETLDNHPDFTLEYNEVYVFLSLEKGFTSIEFEFQNNNEANTISLPFYIFQNNTVDEIVSIIINDIIKSKPL